MDWGIGHATRTAPIIEFLLERNCEPVIAGYGDSLSVIQAQFPELKYVSLPPYAISYKSGLAYWDILLRLQHIHATITAEQSFIREWVKHNRIDGIISDNRYGVYLQNKPSVLITHQTQPRFPGIASGLSSLSNPYFIRLFKNFQSIWVPDLPNVSLTGALAHNRVSERLSVKYIGPLSRLKATATNTKTRIVGVVSGPEPERTSFEQYLRKHLSSYGRQAKIVTGNLSSANQEGYADHTLLSDLLQSCELVVARSGYSTVMDLCRFGKQAILIPTRGQTEQHYLAKHLSKKKYCVWFRPERMNLTNEIEAYDSALKFPLLKVDAFKPEVDSWLKSL